MRRHVRTLTTDLVTMNAAAGTRRVAARAAATVLVSLLVLHALGHLDWGIYTTFGAFACVYGGSTPFSGRWRTQLVAGAVLTGAVVSGAAVGTSGERAWLAIPVAAVWGGGAAYLSDRNRWIPPGPLFAVFAAGGSAARPATWGEVAVALAAAGGTALFGVLLGLVEERRAGIPAEPHHGRSRLDLRPERQRLHVARVVVVVAVAGSVATTVGIGHPYWAMVSAVVPLAVPGLRHQLARGVQRGVGTVAGLALALVLLLAHLPVLVTVLVAAGLQAAAELLVVRNYALALVFITPLALLMGHLARPQPVGELVADRFWETVLGLALGLVTAYVTRAGRGASRETGSGTIPA